MLKSTLGELLSRQEAQRVWQGSEATCECVCVCVMTGRRNDVASHWTVHPQRDRDWTSSQEKEQRKKKKNLGRMLILLVARENKIERKKEKSSSNSTAPQKPWDSASTCGSGKCVWAGGLRRERKIHLCTYVFVIREWHQIDVWCAHMQMHMQVQNNSYGICQLPDVRFNKDVHSAHRGRVCAPCMCARRLGKKQVVSSDQWRTCQGDRASSVY